MQHTALILLYLYIVVTASPRPLAPAPSSLDVNNPSSSDPTSNLSLFRHGSQTPIHQSYLPNPAHATDKTHLMTVLTPWEEDLEATSILTMTRIAPTFKSPH
jgi:hypothetical protein